MSWMHFVLAVVVAGVATSFTDWFFFGFLFHRKYFDTPDVWRKMPQGQQIAWSMLVAVLAIVFFFHACSHFGVHGYHQVISLAMFAWIFAAIPIVITTTLYVKYTPLFAVTHSLGYLARFLVAAVAYVWFLGK